MAKNFKDLMSMAKAKEVQKLAVANAQDHEVLTAVRNAVAEGIVEPILVGDEEKIREIAKEIDFDLSKVKVINELDGVKACEIAVKKVSSGEASVLMKGLIDTGIIMKAVLNKEWGLRTDRVISHVAIFELPTYHKLLFITDAAMNVAPQLEQKKDIVHNAIDLARSLEIEKPKVAMIAAKEKFDEKMPATVDAKALSDMCKEGEFGDAIVDGPFALDNAISKEACEIKGVNSPVGGDADIVVMPMIEAGNVLYKALTYFVDKEENAGLILGTAAPIVLTSRADSDVTKLNSIALAVMNAK
ncbi:MAG: phosphate butyryltransferase [Tissierellia bacterium]|nr:phosphate butyryltransferase [Tissierellia bacterium]